MGMVWLFANHLHSQMGEECNDIRGKGIISERDNNNNNTRVAAIARDKGNYETSFASYHIASCVNH